MFDDNQKLVAAIELAVHSHGPQLDKGGLPYILHPLHVMGCVDSIDAKIVAVLHDVVEDTATTLGWIKNHEAGFSKEIIDAIDAITKRKREKKEDYWARVKANPLALQVKLWDMAHNCSPKRLAVLSLKEADYLVKKYDTARAFFAADDGLVPLIVNRSFIDARTMLENVGYGERARKCLEELDK